MQQLKMTIDGMSCGGCVSTVEKALRTIPSVRLDAVNVGSASVSYDESRTTPAAIAQAVADAGYDAHMAGSPALAGARRATSGGCCGGATIEAKSSDGRNGGGNSSCCG